MPTTVPLMSEFFSGVFAGITVLVAAFSLLVGQAFREPMLRWHAATLAVGLLAQLPLAIPSLHSPAVLWLLQLVLALHTLAVVLGHGGAVRRPARSFSYLIWALAPLMLLRLAGLDLHLLALLPWLAITTWYLVRAWGQSRPWIYWLLIGQTALGIQWLLVGFNTIDPHAKIIQISTLPTLALFACATYIAMVWRSRLLSENSLRVEARERVDPLTGLATPRVFHERAESAVVRSKNLGYSSALLMLRLRGEERANADPDAGEPEAITLSAAQVISRCLRPQDVAARLGSNRFGVLAEGVNPEQGGQDLATRILAGGLRVNYADPMGKPLRFQIVVIEITNPQTDAGFFMQVLDNAMRQMMVHSDGPPIRTLS